MNQNEFRRIKFNRKTRAGILIRTGEFRIQSQHITAETFTVIDENKKTFLVSRKQMYITITGFDKEEKHPVKTCESCRFEPSTKEERAGITCRRSPEPVVDESGNCYGWYGKEISKSSFQYGTGNQATYSEVL